MGVEADNLIGECKDVMVKYLACIKKVKGTNEEECRGIAKSYLGCRMDRYGTYTNPIELLVMERVFIWRIGMFADGENRNLMAKDEFKNLGFGDEKKKTVVGGDGGKKGELRWE